MEMLYLNSEISLIVLQLFATIAVDQRVLMPLHEAGALIATLSILGRANVTGKVWIIRIILFFRYLSNARQSLSLSLSFPVVRLRLSDCEHTRPIRPSQGAPSLTLLLLLLSLSLPPSLPRQVEELSLRYECVRNGDGGESHVGVRHGAI